MDEHAKPARSLSRPDRYLLASKADVDVRVVDTEWERWTAGEAAQGVVRAGVRRVAVVLAFAGRPLRTVRGTTGTRAMTKRDGDLVD